MPRKRVKDAKIYTVKMYAEDRPSFKMVKAFLEREKNYEEDIKNEDVVHHLLEFWKQHNKEKI
jgi:hypothetical protein